MSQNKERITITLSKEVIEWIYKQMEQRTFASVSHACEYLIYHAKQKEDGEKDKEI